MKQQNFPLSTSKAQKLHGPLDLVHADIAYAMPETAQGYQYFIVLIDDFSRYTWAYALKSRATVELLPILKFWLNNAQTQRERKLKTLRADRAGELTSNDLKEFAGSCGFNLEYAAPKAHQQNGVAEKAIDILRGGTNATLSKAKLSHHFSPYALDDHVWAQNRTIHKHDLTKTPFELWEGYPPNVASARTFGCMALFYVPRESRLKHEPRAK